MGAFRDCTSLALTELPVELTSIGEAAFQNCISLALSELPAGLTSIGVAAFQGCTNLMLTKLPEQITRIRYNTFSNCSSLEVMELPAGLTHIDSRAFYGCTNLVLVISHAINPPSLEWIPSWGINQFNNTHNNLVINVPAQSVETYKNRWDWSEYAHRIAAME